MERIQVPLSHGTLLLMSGATQDDWQVGSTNQLQESKRMPTLCKMFRWAGKGYRAGVSCFLLELPGDLLTSSWGHPELLNLKTAEVHIESGEGHKSFYYFN